ncbi:esterase-like activity of phytase family protein [Salinarimonas rosea]|uniref:esterase-like activity of phytase family protein n=1 Tax=Salinarimonas rosea TaxID=552063 RepID=UPI0003FCCF0C|nr:esterase-like activity of phytase family protein [Salinarimonas rosea]
MRLTRRGLLAGLATAAAGALAPAPRARADLEGPLPLALRTYPIRHLGPRGLVEGLYGRLRYRGGIELQAGADAFGGLSGLVVLDGGEKLLAVSDRGYFLAADILRGLDGAVVDLANAVLAPLRGPGGRLLRRQGSYDAEALTLAGATAYVGIEQEQAVFAFDLAAGIAAPGRRLALPPAVRAVLDPWPGNKGMETLFVAPAPSAFPGALVAIAERARRGDATPTVGVVLTGARAGATFAVARSDAFEVTDCAVLPDGDLLLLERRYALTSGVAARIRRVPGADLRPEAILDGAVIFEADWTNAIDNMEGLAVHRGPDGETILTMIADDNYSILQRTLLLEFELV